MHLLLLSACLLAEPVLIPAGTFTMGRTKLTSDDATKMRPQILLDDRPTHEVSISAFYLDTHEVTQAEYAVFVKEKKHAPPYHWVAGKVPEGGEKLPAYNVSWDDARAYCAAQGARLPTEAEWERAARGGLEAMDYPWGDKFDAKLLRSGVELGPQEVGKYRPNAFGLFDMAGNVSEWVADYFDREYYARSPASDPPGPESGIYRVIRGGAWSDAPRRVTVYFRNWVRPSQRQPNIGFRCAKSAP
ncbi:MAG: formylglycine-generating enzyme family protein [Bryobacteraceae bacterium]|nr:formylglycine-generating enzyme family protein [Bryobacteraceae bacterium]